MAIIFTQTTHIVVIGRDCLEWMGENKEKASNILKKEEKM